MGDASKNSVLVVFKRWGWLARAGVKFTLKLARKIGGDVIDRRSTHDPGSNHSFVRPRCIAHVSLQ